MFKLKRLVTTLDRAISDYEYWDREHTDWAAERAKLITSRVPSNNIDNYFYGYWQDMPPILKKNVNQSAHDLEVASSNLRLWLGNSKVKKLMLDFYLKYAKIKIARRYYE